MIRSLAFNVYFYSLTVLAALLGIALVIGIVGSNSFRIDPIGLAAAMLAAAP